MAVRTRFRVDVLRVRRRKRTVDFKALRLNDKKKAVHFNSESYYYGSNSKELQRQFAEPLPQEIYYRCTCRRKVLKYFHMLKLYFVKDFLRHFITRVNIFMFLGSERELVDNSLSWGLTQVLLQNIKSFSDFSMQRCLILQ